MRTAPSAQTGSKLRGGNSPGQLNKIQWLSGRRFKCSTDHRVGGIFFPLDTRNSVMSHGRLQGFLPSSRTHRVITAEKTQTCGATGQGIIRQENDTLRNTVTT